MRQLNPRRSRAMPATLVACRASRPASPRPWRGEDDTPGVARCPLGGHGVFAAQHAPNSLSTWHRVTVPARHGESRAPERRAEEHMRMTRIAPTRWLFAL